MVVGAACALRVDALLSCWAVCVEVAVALTTKSVGADLSGSTVGFGLAEATTVGFANQPCVAVVGCAAVGGAAKA